MPHFPKTVSLTTLGCLLYLVPALSPAGEAEDLTVHSDHPAGPPQVVELEEIWRIGGADDDHVFGLMIDARCDKEGNVYLLDHQLSRVTVVSPAGQYIAELGGEPRAWKQVANRPRWRPAPINLKRQPVPRPSL